MNMLSKTINMFLLITFFISKSVILAIEPNCTKCTWVGWMSWDKCQTSGAMRRTRLACCPDDLAEFTLEECFARCYNDSKGQMMLDELYGYRACNLSEFYSK